jgi:hypothetical protein
LELEDRLGAGRRREMPFGLLSADFRGHGATRLKRKGQWNRYSWRYTDEAFCKMQKRCWHPHTKRGERVKSERRRTKYKDEGRQNIIVKTGV